jgi:hypothetical protein
VPRRSEGVLLQGDAVAVHGVAVGSATAHDELLGEPVAATFDLHGSDRGRPDRVLVYDGPVEVRRRE